MSIFHELFGGQRKRRVTFPIRITSHDLLRRRTFPGSKSVNRRGFPGQTPSALHSNQRLYLRRWGGTTIAETRLDRNTISTWPSKRIKKNSAGSRVRGLPGGCLWVVWMNLDCLMVVFAYGYADSRKMLFCYVEIITEWQTGESKHLRAVLSFNVVNNSCIFFIYLRWKGGGIPQGLNLGHVLLYAVKF